MSELKDMLKNRIAEKKVTPIIDIADINYSNKELYDDLKEKEDSQFLVLKKYEYESFKVKGALYLGKFWEDVAQKLGNNKTGKYTAFVKDLGESDRTILRYRNRYKLHSKILNEENRKKIAVASYEMIEKISNSLNSIEKLNKGEKYEDIVNQLLIPGKEIKDDNRTQEEIANDVNDSEIIEVSLKEAFTNIFAKIDVIDTLDDKKKKKAEKLLSELRKIIDL